MRVDEECFDARNVERYCMGAGIIPISVCPDTNVPHLLLGRERWVPSWKGSCTWSGFEGSRKDCESTRMSAAREFVEESMGCVRLCPNDGDSPYDRIRDVIHKLDTGDYWKRIVLRIDTERKSERYHTTFLVTVPWCAEAPARFFDVRTEVEHVDRLVQEWNCALPDIVGEVGEDIGPVAFSSEGTTVCVEKSIQTSSTLLRPPWKRVGEVLRATFEDPDEVERVRLWCTLRGRVQRAVTRFAHPCICVQRDARWKLVQRVYVNADYLEKDQIRWWSVDALSDVIAGRGQAGIDRFRPYFLPVLQTALNLIRARTSAMARAGEEEGGESVEEDVSTLCVPCSVDPSIEEAPSAPPAATAP